MEKPLVSVITNTYNHKEYIAEAIESVLMQKTTFPFELIIGDDESDDGTREICKAYAEKYPHIIRLFLRSRKDVIYVNGYPTGRNNIIENFKAAEGKYIALLPGDDYWNDECKLQKQVDFLEANPDCVACHHWQRHAVPDGEGGYKEVSANHDHGYLKQEKASVHDIFTNKLRIKSRTTLYRNDELLKNLPEWFKKVQYGDVALSMMLGKLGNFGFIDEPMAVYRLTGKGVSDYGDFYKKLKYWITIWEYGNNYYSGIYWKSARLTIIRFNHHILKYYKYSYVVFLRLLFRALFRSVLPWYRRPEVFFRIILVYFRRNLDFS
jgi:glycosyltransferase involved in cell wall biosynthesis